MLEVVVTVPAGFDTVTVLFMLDTGTTFGVATIAGAVTDPRKVTLEVAARGVRGLATVVTPLTVIVTVLAGPLRPGVKPATTPGVLVNTGRAAAVVLIDTIACVVATIGALYTPADSDKVVLLTITGAPLSVLHRIADAVVATSEVVCEIADAAGTVVTAVFAVDSAGPAVMTSEAATALAVDALEPTPPFVVKFAQAMIVLFE